MLFSSRIQRVNRDREWKEWKGPVGPCSAVFRRCTFSDPLGLGRHPLHQEQARPPLFLLTLNRRCPDAQCQNSVIPCRSFASRGHRIASSVVPSLPENKATNRRQSLCAYLAPFARTNAAARYLLTQYSSGPTLQNVRQTTGSTAPFPSKSANPDAGLDPGLQEQEKRRPPSCIPHHPASRLHCIIPAPNLKLLKQQPCENTHSTASPSPPSFVGCSTAARVAPSCV